MLTNACVSAGSIMPRVTEFVLLWTCSSCAVTYYWVQADETAKPVHAPGADKFTCSGEGVSDPSYAAPPGQGGVDNATASYTYTDLGVGVRTHVKDSHCQVQTPTTTRQRQPHVARKLFQVRLVSDVLTENTKLTLR